ncbi:MAG: spore maturation protein [Alicyclobacillaceae bacterium]|jgi:spore maturation protein B|uniref:spore maturation protein n=1 Tax=Alicyclobacillus sp. SP_1 TaxID=2942475 RepID=UPI0021588529|nr:nucleoside recognition domain-containing protein [Alicyclobacillus sp. SP_1]MCY0889015.1 spore maturation protein [Alicyclobacillaceae bacterium]
MQSTLIHVSEWLLPILVATILITGFVRRIPLYNTFIDGAKSGFGTAVRLIPHLVAMMVAVQVFRVSGAMAAVIHWMTPVLHLFHIPPEVAPLGLLRPISGQGSLALMIDVFKKHGPDSALGLLASTMQASTDTTLYILTVYFGSVGIRNFRYALSVGLLADLVAVLASVLAVYVFMGHGL